jgi:hypothetical protein
MYWTFCNLKPKFCNWGTKSPYRALKSRKFDEVMTMTLLKRIAINDKNPGRKNEATRLLAAKDQPLIDAWHQQLQAEIRRKRIRPGRTR